GEDARGARRQLAADGPVGGDDAGEVHLGERVDDPRATDPRHLDVVLVELAVERRIVGPAIDADDLEHRLERRRVDPDALDRAGDRPLSAAELGALEGRSSRTRRGELAVTVAQYDLGV